LKNPKRASENLTQTPEKEWERKSSATHRTIAGESIENGKRIKNKSNNKNNKTHSSGISVVSLFGKRGEGRGNVISHG